MKAKLDHYYWAQGHLARGACLSPKKAKHMVLLAPEARPPGGSGTGLLTPGLSHCWQRQHHWPRCGNQAAAASGRRPERDFPARASRSSSLVGRLWTPPITVPSWRLRNHMLDSKEPRAEHIWHLLLPQLPGKRSPSHVLVPVSATTEPRHQANPPARTR